MTGKIKDKISREFLKLLYSSFNFVRPFLQTILPNRVWLNFKSAWPGKNFQSNVDKILVEEWRVTRMNRPWNDKLKRKKDGINLVGFFQVAKGIGEAARANLKSLSAVKIPYSVINYDTGIPHYLKTETLPSHPYLGSFIFNTNLIHINPPQMPYLWKRFKKTDLAERYTIGVWYWELPEFPDEWKFAFDLVDEVWVASQFVHDSVSTKSPIPVIKIPPCIELGYYPAKQRGDFNLPTDRFLFLCAYDVLSTQARKNPRGAIEAFKRAFPRVDTSVGLVIKVINAQQNLAEIKNLRAELHGYPNCYFIEDIYDKLAMNSLLNLVDVYISLHRSEGFGLIPAEAMYLGKPVVMTNWSGNVDLMTEKNSCGVNYNLVPVGYNTGPYTSDQLWADPNIDHAVDFLRRLRNDSTYYANISREAHRTIRMNFSPQATGNAIRSRLFDLGLI